MPTPRASNLANWIDQGLARKGRGAVTELANRLNLTTDKISKMRDGGPNGRRPRASELPIIEDYFAEPSPARISRRVGQARGVRVIGYVGAGAAAHRYDLEASDLDEVPPPLGSGDKTVAVEIRGDSLGANFDRWLAFYDDVRSPVTQDLIGRLCVVGLDDDRVLIKKILAGRLPGTFDLISERGEPIRAVRIKWAARVKNMTPR